VTPASPDHVAQALGMRLCDCRRFHSNSAGISTRHEDFVGELNIGLLSFVPWMAA
jgi:hypothetical protein